MKGFNGFTAKTGFTPIPNLFFSALLPQIDDLAELKVTLHIFWTMYHKRGYPRFITYRELLGDPSLVGGLESDGSPLQTGECRDTPILKLLDDLPGFTDNIWQERNSQGSHHRLGCSFPELNYPIYFVIALTL